MARWSAKEKHRDNFLHLHPFLFPSSFRGRLAVHAIPPLTSSLDVVKLDQPPDRYSAWEENSNLQVSGSVHALITIIKPDKAQLAKRNYLIVEVRKLIMYGQLRTHARTHV